MESLDSSLKFQPIREKLGISQNVYDKACQMLDELLVNYTDEYSGDPGIWFCALVYTVSIDERYPYGMSDPHVMNGTLSPPSPTVTELLKEADINMVAFFKKLRVVKETCNLSQTVHQNIINLERNYCIVSAIFFKFEKLFNDIFQQDEENPSKFEATKRICWMLFVLARSSGCQCLELVTAFNILLCCFESVIQESQSFQLHEPFDATLREAREIEDETLVLKQLCLQFSSSYDETASLYQNHWKVLLQSLPKDENGFDLARLASMCEACYERDGDFNALLFLDDDPHLIPETRTSPLKVNTPHTPVRSALTSVQALKNILACTSDVPSPVLQSYFQSCSVNPSNIIRDRVEQLREIFVCEFCKEMGATEDTTARLRIQMAVRLYYRVLEAMLVTEEDRLHTKDFTQLLTTDTFHRSLIGCAVEVVMVTYGLSWTPTLASPGSQTHRLAFPWILDIFQLKAYSFYKVLDSFIKAEPKLARDIIDHLHSLEVQILESLVWRHDSPVFDVIRAHSVDKTPPASSVPVTMSSPVAGTSSASSLTSAQLFASPIPSRTPAAQSSPAPAAMGSPPGKHYKSVSLNHFFNKVCRMAFQRLKFLCSHLNVQRELQFKIWSCVEHCITHEPHLMKNRHLDQMVMCSVYGLCKVLNEELKFKTIVNIYRMMPQSSHNVFKNVFIKEGTYDSIITFYNRVFIPIMKAYIHRFSPQRNTPASPVSSNSVQLPQPTATMSSPVRIVPGRSNIHLSPMSESPFKVPLTPSRMTPRTRKLYSFGENLGSSEVLKSINESMNRFKALKRDLDTTKGGAPRSLKRLKFDTPADEMSDNSVDQTAEPKPQGTNVLERRTAEYASDKVKANMENSQ